MKPPLKQIQLGSLTLANNILYAPLAGCSDFPFRKMSSKHSPGLVVCEMVKMDALIRYDPVTLHMLDYDSSMHPISAQLCGSKPQIAGKAAKIIEDLGFDAVDLNCGCPVDKVTKDGSGSGMLRNPQLIGDVLANMVAAVKIPVTVKIRAGWDEANIVAAQVTEIAERAGAKAICIHGRTRKQAYKGPANWDYIKEAKEAAKNILVIGNGDVVDGPSAEKMFQHTGCDAVLVARGTMGKPWVVHDIIAHFMGEPIEQKTLEMLRHALLEHFRYIAAYQCPRRVAVDMRRIGCWYFKRSAATKAFREAISKAESMERVEDMILNFPIGDHLESDAEEEECNFEC